MTTVLFQLLAGDKTAIAYRKPFARLTGDPLAAILLQQMIFHWESKGRRPFYKFRQKCGHALYRPEDSWCEELEWSPSAFDNALKIIGTKITKGVSKKSAREVEMPFRREGESDEAFAQRLADALKHVVIYWTDANRLTWYEINETLLGNFINQIYLDKSYGLKYLKASVCGDTLKRRKAKVSEKLQTPELPLESETPTETPTKKKDSAPTGATMPQSLWNALILQKALPYFILAATIEEARKDFLLPTHAHGKRHGLEATWLKLLGPTRCEWTQQAPVETTVEASLVVEAQSGPPYPCTNKDINEMIAIWYEWVPKRPTKRGKVIPESEHYKVPANREFARNLFERGARPADFVYLLNEIQFAEEGTKWAYYRGKELTFCYVCELLQEWLPAYREDWWYTPDEPRITPRRKGLKMHLNDFLDPGRELLVRYANHPDFIVDVPPPYVTPHDLEQEVDIPHNPVTAEQIRELAERGEL